MIAFAKGFGSFENEPAPDRAETIDASTMSDRESSLQISDTHRNYREYLALSEERDNGDPINDVLDALYDGESLSEEEA